LLYNGIRRIPSERGGFCFGEDMKYRKKPIVVEVIQFTGDNYADVRKFAEPKTVYPHLNNLFIVTLEGTMVAAPYDFIIKGIQGEIYPCKKDIFEQTYEPVI